MADRVYIKYRNTVEIEIDRPFTIKSSSQNHCPRICCRQIADEKQKTKIAKRNYVDESQKTHLEIIYSHPFNVLFHFVIYFLRVFATNVYYCHSVQKINAISIVIHCVHRSHASENVITITNGIVGGCTVLSHNYYGWIFFFRNLSIGFNHK